MPAPNRPAFVRPLIWMGLVGLIAFLLQVPSGARGVDWVEPGEHRLRERSASVADLGWLFPDGEGPAMTGGASLQRPMLLRQKERHQEASDAAGAARINGVLVGETFVRASRVLERWLLRRDRATGLLPESTAPDGQVWSYRDVASDLFPHLTIAAWMLAPDRYGELLGVLAAERRRAPDLPDDILLRSGVTVGSKKDESVFGAAEYAKDGLLPLLERLGPDPWLARLVEIGDVVIEEAEIETDSHGEIPGHSTEVNGDMLQVLARLYWATGEQRFYRAAERIAGAYLEDVLPETGYLPPNRWDFVRDDSLGKARFTLSDHGNEVVSGLIEWHLAETLRHPANAAAHRRAIRRMLDRLLEIGRNEDGMWQSVIDVPSGNVRQDGPTDNWGYLFQAYLTQASIETLAPDGDPRRAAEYRAAARTALRALPEYEHFRWEDGQMDGYADTLESAIYLLDELDEPTAAAWVDEQVGVLFGFQDDEGRVLDGYLDGNFIRTALLYGSWLTRGVRLDPWQPGVLAGAAPDGDCLALSLYGSTDWEGRLVFDTPRHRLHGRLPIDYPRLNKWPEWFVAEAGSDYEVAGLEAAGPVQVDGAELADGLPVRLAGGAGRALRVCPVG